MMIKNKFYLSFHLRRWLLSCLLFLLYSCQDNNPILPATTHTKQDSLKAQQGLLNAYKHISEIEPEIKTGDLITRTGNDFTSESLRLLNRRNTTYSHCGIASIENDTVFVYHALGGEFNPDQRLRKDPFKVFASPLENRGIGLFRFNQPLMLSPVLDTVKSWKNAGLTFDMDFDLTTNDKMYCAEFVAKAYSAETQNILKFNTSRIKDFVFIGVDDVFMNPNAHIIKRIKY